LKPLRPKKNVLGIAIGERSLLAAEVVAGDRPSVKRAQEMPYPQGLSLANPAELGKALGHFLKENHFESRSAVIGIPVKWLVVKPKEVPPADDATVVQLLRLEAEAEFSSELKDLVYDYTGDVGDKTASRSVLLTATSRKHIEEVEALCESARLQPLAVMPSAIAIGSLTGASMNRNLMVLSVGQGGAELSWQHSGAATAIRGLRPPTPQPPFLSELRRAVSNLGAAEVDREMVLWDGAGLDGAALSEQLGLTVKNGELSALGVEANGLGANGQSSRFAPAVALAMVGIGAADAGIDFLNSRLAPPRDRLIPRWAYPAAAALVVAIILAIWAYRNVQNLQMKLDQRQAMVNAEQTQVTAAQQFIDKVTLAQYWHLTDPRYLAAMRDLDDVIPEDGQTYATSLDIKGQTPQVAPAGTAAAPAANAPDPTSLFIILQGRTPNLESVTALEDRMRHNPTAFQEIKIGPTTKVPRTNEFTFEITFTYVPAKLSESLR
jgi:hypothetical protein